MVKKLPANAGDPVRSLGWGDTLQKGMATHSRIHALRIPWTEEPGRLHARLRDQTTTITTPPPPTAALFTIAKIWKQPKCPSTDEWIRKMWYKCVLLSCKKEQKFCPLKNMDVLGC